jgi:hypothetical protein
MMVKIEYLESQTDDGICELGCEQIFGLTRKEVIIDWRKLHNEQSYCFLFTKFCLRDQIVENELVEA